jgi:hypothetical protein
MLLALLGTAAGIVYALLGVVALQHLPRATETDKSVGWSLWWVLERGRYTPEGQRLCTYGAVTGAVAVGCWLSSTVLH